MIIFRLNSTDEHVKNYAPQVLALTGPPGARPALIHLANLITKNNSLLISGEVFPVSPYIYPIANIIFHLILVNTCISWSSTEISRFQTRLSYYGRSARRKDGYTWLYQQRIKSFYHIVDNLSLEQGIAALMQITGIGKLAPNVLLMGYKTNWSTCEHKDLEEYLNVLQ